MLLRMPTHVSVLGLKSLPHDPGPSPEPPVKLFWGVMLYFLDQKIYQTPHKPSYEPLYVKRRENVQGLYGWMYCYRGIGCDSWRLFMVSPSY